jgi:hypothetical protein
MNSLATVGESGSSKSSLSCDTMKAWMSPPTTTGLEVFFRLASSRPRAAG